MNLLKGFNISKKGTNVLTLNGGGNIGAIIVFIITYVLFSLAGFSFPSTGNGMTRCKTDWTPSGSVIGIIWAVLFALISLSAALIYAKFSCKESKAFG